MILINAVAGLAPHGGRISPGVQDMLAKDLMTRAVATVGPASSLLDVIRIMTERHVSGVPVTDDDHHLVGIITEGDLLRRVEIGTWSHRHSWWVDLLLRPGASAGEYIRGHARRVSDLMTSEVFSAEENDAIDVVVEAMVRHNIKRVPVTSGGRLVGIVSRRDLVRSIGQALEVAAGGQEGAQAQRDDGLIRDRLLAVLAKEPWFPKANIRISVKEGVAVVGGVVSDERVHCAILAAAEDAAGVRTVRDEIDVLPAAAGFPM